MNRDDIHDLLESDPYWVHYLDRLSFFRAATAYKTGFEKGIETGDTWGHARGFADGYAQSEADMAALQRWAVGITRGVANRPDYATLCDIRGEHDRARDARARMARIDREMGWVA